ncbi:hypothetical protein [Planobispora longispora]|uniref:Uncharacterized protein n=1 Tax=Planobispora longispora TaxID=28887 RepID=A0A8J3W6N4_9ACTN|nr:hypothetical protein [Planobispora longispora]BFE80167.1 hypothetical protein GCM10020093_027680 [Planobispora longispora]GIH76996.1 hypothetical protein Plo01_34250 [Planobispora longispora]
MVVLPFVNTAFTSRVPFRRSIEQLGAEGVRVPLGPGEFELGYNTGFASAGGEGPLSGFREWLIMRLGTESSLGREGLVLQLILSEASFSSPSPDADAQAVAALFELLDRFMEECATEGDAANIIEKYHAWHQSWLDTVRSSHRRHQP